MGALAAPLSDVLRQHLGDSACNAFFVFLTCALPIQGCKMRFRDEILAAIAATAVLTGAAGSAGVLVGLHRHWAHTKPPPTLELVE